MRTKRQFKGLNNGQNVTLNVNGVEISTNIRNINTLFTNIVQRSAIRNTLESLADQFAEKRARTYSTTVNGISVTATLVGSVTTIDPVAESEADRETESDTVA